MIVRVGILLNAIANASSKPLAHTTKVLHGMCRRCARMRLLSISASGSRLGFSNLFNRSKSRLKVNGPEWVPSLGFEGRGMGSSKVAAKQGVQMTVPEQQRTEAREERAEGSGEAGRREVCRRWVTWEVTFRTDYLRTGRQKERFLTLRVFYEAFPHPFLSFASLTGEPHSLM